jgi:hypothetical protein
MSSVFLSFLDNHRPLSNPVLSFWTDSTPINLCKGRKHSAPRIGDDDFRAMTQILTHRCKRATLPTHDKPVEAVVFLVDIVEVLLV